MEQTNATQTKAEESPKSNHDTRISEQESPKQNHQTRISVTRIPKEEQNQKKGTTESRDKQIFDHFPIGTPRKVV